MAYGEVVVMNWLVKLVVIWMSIDILMLATSWYGVTVIKPRYPDWWKRVIVDHEPMMG